MEMYTDTLNKEWEDKYTSSSMWGKPKVNDTELDYEQLYTDPE